MPRSPESGAQSRKTGRFTRRVEVLVSEDQYEFMHDEFEEGQIAHHVRALLDAHRGQYNKELAELEKEYAEVEPRYMSLKKRIEELRQQKKRMEEDQKAKEKSIEYAHKKILEALKRYNWHVEEIPKSTYKIYSDMTGLSVEELKSWTEEKAKTRGE